MKILCVTILLILSTNLCSAQPQSGAGRLTNKDIIDLVKSGLSQEIIVAKIKQSPSTFDTSPAALQDLKSANVPEPIILAMVQAPTPGNPLTSTDTPASRSGVKNLYEVRKIYIDDMGKSDDAERFRLLLREKLSDKKFTIVDDPNEADAILKGTLSTQLAKGTTKARASVFLKSQSGATLWSDDFGVHLVFVSALHRDSVKLRAEDVADGLHGAWKKSAKAAGIKTNE